MGINELQLSPELIALLYPETLILTSDVQGSEIIPKTGTQEAISPVYPFLGRNKKSICFLVHFPNDEFISPGQLIFLQKILTACRFTLDDIALINTGQNSISLNAIKNQFNPHLIFLWGRISNLPENINGLNDLEIAEIDHLKILPVFNCELMSRENAEGQELKRKLWICLKKLFNL